MIWWHGTLMWSHGALSWWTSTRGQARVDIGVRGQHASNTCPKSARDKQKENTEIKHEKQRKHTHTNTTEHKNAAIQDKFANQNPRCQPAISTPGSWGPWKPPGPWAQRGQPPGTHGLKPEGANRTAKNHWMPKASNCRALDLIWAPIRLPFEGPQAPWWSPQAPGRPGGVLFDGPGHHVGSNSAAVWRSPGSLGPCWGAVGSPRAPWSLSGGSPGSSAPF